MRKSYNLKSIESIENQLSMIKKTTSGLFRNNSAKEEPTIRVEDDRTGMSSETLKRAFLDNLFYIQGINRSDASNYDYYVALAYTIRDRLLHRFLKTTDTYKKKSHQNSVLSIRRIFDGSSPRQ